MNSLHLAEDIWLFSVNDAYEFPHWHTFSYLDIWCLDCDYRHCYTPTNFVLLITPGFKYYSIKFFFIYHAIINNAFPESLFAPKGSDPNLPFGESSQNFSTGETWQSSLWANACTSGAHLSSECLFAVFILFPIEGLLWKYKDTFCCVVASIFYIWTSPLNWKHTKEWKSRTSDTVGHMEEKGGHENKCELTQCAWADQSRLRIWRHQSLQGS